MPDLNSASMVTALHPNWISTVSIVATILGSIGVGGMLKTWLDYKRGTRKDTDEIALGLVNRLTARLDVVEKESMKERALCDARLAIQRHRINNTNGNFRALLMMIEMAPDRLSEAVERIKEQMAEQEKAEAVEKATLAAVAATYGVEVDAAE